MGIRDIFKRRKNKINIDNKLDKEVGPDCSLSYKSGVKADISFKGLEEIQLDDGTQKLLQKVVVMYNNPDKTFDSRDYYMEPIIDQNGNNITKENYMQLINLNLPLLKGFFEKSQVKNEPTNYLGYIGYDQNNVPFRAKDINFERAYKGHLDRKIARENYEKEARFEKELQDMVENVSVHIDDNQPEDLSKYRSNPPYSDRYR